MISNKSAKYPITNINYTTFLFKMSTIIIKFAKYNEKRNKNVLSL